MWEIKKIPKLINITGIVSGIDVVHSSDFYFAGEIHDFWEIVLVRNGEIISTGDDRVYRLKKGMAVFHKPMEFHTLKVESNNTRLNILAFSASGEGMKQFENKCIELSADESVKLGTVNNRFIAAVNSHIEGRIAEFIREGNFGVAALEELLLAISDRSYDREKTLTGKERLYLSVIELMRENINKPLTVTEIAKLCNMSESSLKKLFRFYSDVGVAKFFLRMKLRRSMELFDEGLSVGEVCDMLGFSDISYFSSAFKREVGLTARSYKFRNNDSFTFAKEIK